MGFNSGFKGLIIFLHTISRHYQTFYLQK